jgi:hypothetical protein
VLPLPHFKHYQLAFPDMKKLLITGLVTLLLAGGAGAWLMAAPSVEELQATSRVGVPVVEPAAIVVNSPSTVTVAAQISDPSVIATGVNLLRVDSNGRTLATAGTLNDAGLSGDAVAGDKVFSGQVTIAEPTVGAVYFRVSAAFKGLLLRQLSSVVSLEVQTATLEYVDASAGYRISYPREMGVSGVDSVRPGFLGGTVFAPSDGVPSVSVSTYLNPLSLPVEDWYNTTLADREYNVSDADLRVTSLVTVNGISSLQVRSTAYDWLKVRTYVPVNGKVFGIEISHLNNQFGIDDPVPDVYGQMLNSFRPQ